jgi:hypothetical protein
MHYATESGSLQLQMKKCPIDGLHMGTPQCICMDYNKVVPIRQLISLDYEWIHWL